MKHTEVRHECCSNCPFHRKMDLSEVVQVLENYPDYNQALEVLCHTDGFEDGSEYHNCRGFRTNLERLGLL